LASDVTSPNGFRRSGSDASNASAMRINMAPLLSLAPGNSPVA
jgi:hypothetical protein